MGAAVAAIIRITIQAAVTTGIWIGVDKILIPYLQKQVQDYMMSQGMTEEEAKDSVANDVIEIVGTFGAIAVSIRSKFPTKAAEYLGFTSKGWSKRVIIKKGPAPKPGTVSGPVPPAAVVATTAAAAATTSVGKLKALGKGAAALGGFLERRANTSFIAIIALTGLIDFGNWETGAYSDFFQKVFAKVSGGLFVPNEDYRKTKTVSPEVFDKVFNTYKLEGAVGINDPYKQMQVEFSRDNLIDLLDKVGADLLLRTGGASTKDVLEASQYLISFDKNVVKQYANSIGYYGPMGGSTTSGASTAPKVYTGIVSQGVLGRGLEFIPRQDDLIESAEELKAAAANNLSPFLQSLLGKIVYEVKIVSSIITKEGFKQTGVVQQVRNGSYADGKPKYKSVYNKFATMDLYVITDKGARSKISTIVLGPTDSARLNLGTNELRSIEAAIPDLVFTKDINEITGIETINAVTVSTPASAGGKPIPAPPTGKAVTSAAPASTPAPRASARGLNALTLSDWFAAQGQTLPPIAARAVLYESLELGSVNYYSGTSEQNTKLLAALKNQAQRRLTNAVAIDAEDDAPEGTPVERINGQLYMFPLPAENAEASTKKRTLNSGEKKPANNKPTAAQIKQVNDLKKTVASLKKQVAAKKKK